MVEKKKEMKKDKRYICERWKRSRVARARRTNAQGKTKRLRWNEKMRKREREIQREVDYAD